MIILSLVPALNKFQSNPSWTPKFVENKSKVLVSYLKNIQMFKPLQHDCPKKNSQHFSKTFQYHLITIIHHLYHIYDQYD